MKYRYWKCSICLNEFRTNTGMAEFTVEEHLETHTKEYAELVRTEKIYQRGVAELEKKYEKRNLGYWIKNVTPPVKRKLWKCPKCGEEMGYHHKFHHQVNASRNGKPYMCVPITPQPHNPK